MKSKFLIKDIALQAGVGVATVDRVLNKRGNVRQHTADRVLGAIKELEKQRKQLAYIGQKLIVDLVVEAPLSFINALETALAAELPMRRFAAIRFRTKMTPRIDTDHIVQTLKDIERIGSDGVILMAPDNKAICDAIDRLTELGIPVVTLATDIAASNRSAYVGLDNRMAGRTAAWFLGQWFATTASPRILVTIRNDRFSGEGEREEGFREVVSEVLPKASVHLVVEGTERPKFFDELAAFIAEQPIDALYSIGGQNLELVEFIQDRQPRCMTVAHDLDADNAQLIKSGGIDLLLHHDLQEDLRNACKIITALQLSTTRPSLLTQVPPKILVPPMF